MHFCPHFHLRMCFSFIFWFLRCWSHRHSSKEMRYFPKSPVLWPQFFRQLTSFHKWRVFEFNIPTYPLSPCLSWVNNGVRKNYSLFFKEVPCFFWFYIFLQLFKKHWVVDITILEFLTNLCIFFCRFQVFFGYLRIKEVTYVIKPLKYSILYCTEACFINIVGICSFFDQKFYHINMISSDGRDQGSLALLRGQVWVCFILINEQLCQFKIVCEGSLNESSNFGCGSQWIRNKRWFFCEKFLYFRNITFIDKIVHILVISVHISETFDSSHFQFQILQNWFVIN